MQNSSVEDTYFGSNKSIRLKDKFLEFRTPLVMGILNCTPDSFYTGSRSNEIEETVSRAQKMLEEGATIIDIGGYSTRPGATDISEEEEVSRVIPVIQEIAKQIPEAIISIDTFRAKVADEAIRSGASMINDISGFEIDPEIINVAAKHRIPYILMHMRGTPQTMNSLTDYDNLFKEMSWYFSEKINSLKRAGVNDIILDPGFGFAKTIEQNHFLLRHFEAFQTFDQPLLAGLSRKSMIYKKLGITPEDALPGTIALNAIALSKGASILRVHDVKEAVALVRLLGE